MADRGAASDKRRPTLWILNHYALPPGEGAGTRHHDLGQELGRLGWQVVIFAAGFNHFTGLQRHLIGRQLSSSEAFGDVRFVWLRTLPYRGNGGRRILNMLSYLAVVMLVATRARPRPDVIIGSTVHPFAALAAWVLARRFRAKFFFEIRDLWPQSLIDMGAWSAGNPAVRLLQSLEAFLVARADGVISLLPGIEPYLAAHNEQPRTLAYVPNGVRLGQPEDTQRLPAAAASVLDRFGDVFVVGYTGAHGVNNGLDAVLEAAARLEEEGAGVAFILVGDGPEKARLENEARRLGLERIEFLDPVPKAVIPSLLRRFDAGLMTVLPLPVHQYGVSFNKVFDYMASGLPIVFACATPFDPVAEARAGLSVTPGDAGQLAGAILELAGATASSREAMGRRGQAYVASHHDIARLAERLDALLRRGADDAAEAA
ncbi:MAG: glycosyltransferase family 4 protein [Candidatus Limnocylindrales bacterium]